MPEITLFDNFGKAIVNVVKNYALKNVLEIGSWDGKGSTSCFIEGMSQFENKKLTCLEINPSRFLELKNTIKDYSWIEAFNESSISFKSFLFPTFESVWSSPFNKINATKETVAKWYEIDYDAIKNTKVGFLERNKDFYDGVLIDGSEFTGYSEYTLLKDRVNVFFLDDYYNAFKTRQIAEELNNSPEWEAIDGDRYYRQGYAIFARRKFIK